MSKVGAYGTTAKTDREHQERAAEVEEYARKGKKPPRRKAGDDLPKPTELMRQREGSLELDKNVGKTMIVSGNTGTGFYCDVCKRTNKDSVAYLDHINGRSHLRRIGQTTKVVKSTLNDVRAKIADLRAKTASASQTKQYDFEQRLREIRLAEQAAKEARKEEKKAKKEALRPKEAEAPPVDEEMMGMMGFAGFGAGKK
ncbi:hypothetical protein RQP46_001445 [Phenoliferia psychrophenolica]